GQSSIGTLKLGGKNAPKEIDIRLIEGPIPGERIYRGIYKREDVRLTICYTAGDEPRPTEFATKPGSSAMLVVFRCTERRAGGQVTDHVRPSPDLDPYRSLTAPVNLEPYRSLTVPLNLEPYRSLTAPSTDPLLKRLLEPPLQIPEEAPPER